MNDTNYLPYFRRLRISPSYIFLAVLYGVSTLIMPFAVQILVNNLALTGLWLSAIAYLVTIGAVLTAALVVKYFQLILLEFMQRHIFFREIASWQRKVPEEDLQSPYFFEIFNIMKAFSTTTAGVVELGLRILFGGLALIFIHPAFIALYLLLLLSMLILRWQGRGAIKASLVESTSKYDLYYSVTKFWSENQPLVGDYLTKRESRFRFLKRQALTIYVTYVVLQVLQLAWGIYLVQANQLAIGNLVSAEIILSGILYSYSDMPKTLERFYEFETGCIKIDSIKPKPEEHPHET